MLRLLLFLILLSAPAGASAVSLGQTVDFFVDGSFDEQNREEVKATLQKSTSQLHFYTENDWWNALSSEEQRAVFERIDELAVSFEGRIYPVLTDAFGTENRPGVDGDNKITVLLHRMNSSSGGYVRTSDGYTRLESPRSNEREMFYINAERLDSPHAPAFMAHEFMHLVYFNQKENLRGVQDDLWIQEGFAELAPTLVGFAQEFEGSYLESRVEDFKRDPRDSLTEWKGRPADYGVLNMFFHYLNDRYGRELFEDLLRSREKGMAAFDRQLAKRQTSFREVFEDWTIAVFLNDCSVNGRWCYESSGLEDFRVRPLTNFLPVFGESRLTVTNETGDWAGNWNKISGGTGTLRLTFDGEDSTLFFVPYVVLKSDGAVLTGELRLSSGQDGEVLVEDFGGTDASVVIIPSARGKTEDFTDSDPRHSFSWTTELVNGASPPPPPTQSGEEGSLIEEIAELEGRLAQLRGRLAALRGLSSCGSFDRNLAVGMRGQDVVCLQDFLTTQGPEIYPEGLVTGNFFELTRRAVVRFQETYKQDVLLPLGLEEGTGFFGPSSRAKANELRSP